MRSEVVNMGKFPKYTEIQSTLLNQIIQFVAGISLSAFEGHYQFLRIHFSGSLSIGYKPEENE